MRPNLTIFGIMLMLIATNACQWEAPQQEFSIQNDTDMVVSGAFGMNDIEISGENYPYYSTLKLGSIDKNDWCAFCDVQPSINTPSSKTLTVTESRKVFFAARNAQTKEFIYYREFSFDELENMDWIVPITDQRS